MKNFSVVKQAVDKSRKEQKKSNNIEIVDEFFLVIQMLKKHSLTIKCKKDAKMF
jgi:hypothetical protein